MSALDLLLGARPAGETGNAAQPRTLLLSDGLRLHMQESDTADDVILFSHLGRLGDTGHFPQDRAWNASLPHPLCAEARCVVSVDPGSGCMYLIDVWPRASLHPQSFAEFLQDHALRHRVWRGILNEIESRNPASDQYEEGDHEDEEWDGAGSLEVSD